jgi:hypothetical protein
VRAAMPPAAARAGGSGAGAEVSYLRLQHLDHEWPTVKAHLEYELTKEK